METPQKRFLARLATLAKVTGAVLTPDLVELYDKGLCRFGYDTITAALERHLIERRGLDRMPSIGDIARMVVPQETDEDVAVEVAGRIVQAIDKFGWANQREAEDFIGEVGWYVVSKNGGWQSLCEGLLSKNLAVMKAQFREMALSALRRSRIGTLEKPPSFKKLPATDDKTLPSAIGDTIKTLEVRNGNKNR